MPYICMIREDIPNGILQILDLEPNTSLRNQAIDPPGQTKYVNRVVNDTVKLSSFATAAEYSGLAAYLLTNVEDQDNAGIALTAARANAIALALIAALDAGASITESNLNGFIQASTGGPSSTIDGGTSTGSLDDVLKILAGGEYVVPAGTVVQTLGAFVPNAGGDFPENTFRHTYESGALLISLGGGELATFTSSSFEYLGTTGAAVVVLGDDGVVMT